MPWFARERAIEMDEDLRRRVVEDPAFALAMPLEDVARVESAAAEREGQLSLANGECAYAAAFYGLALRALALDRARAPMDASARRRKRIELRLRLGDARAGANEPGRACGAYAAALRGLGLIAKKRATRESEENEPEGVLGRERRDGEECEETYDDGGDEETFAKEKPRIAAAFLRKANESSSKASIKGLVDGEVMFRIGRACQMAGRYNRALLAYETALVLQPDGPRDASATQVYLACGEMYLSLQMADYALECFRKVMKRPMEASLGTGDVLCEIASCYRVLRLPEEESRCMKSVCSDPLHKPIRTTNVIRVAWYRYERDKDAARALRELTEANVVKKTSEGLYTKGRVHAETGNFDAADACYVEACKMEPTSPKIWLEIGNLYLNGFQIPTIAVKAYGRAKELATFMQLQEDALRAARGYGCVSEGQTKFADSSEVTATHENAVIGRGDAFTELGQVSSAFREYEQVPETGRVQIRKMKIMIWAVVALQRAYRRHKARMNAEIASGIRRPALLPAARPQEARPKISEALLAKRANRPKTEVKPAKNKYETITRQITRTATPRDRAPMDMLKDFTIKPAKNYVSPNASPATKRKTKGVGLFDFSRAEQKTPIATAPSSGRTSLFK